jgi:YihY family inner membrane protein
MSRILNRLDRFQRSHRWVAFPFAVVKKFGDDGAGSKAALIAYYAFFSLFPLLLVFTTVLGFILSGHPSLQEKVLRSALSQFPILGDQLSQNVRSLSGNAIALTIGIVGTLWGGMGVTQAAEDAMNAVWNVPQRRLPGFLYRRLRGLILLVVMGVGVIATTFLAGFAASGSGLGLKIGAGVVSAVINFGLFMIAFRVLTAEKLSWRDVLPGAVMAAILWGLLQAVGGWYVARSLRGASQVYGFFAIVIGLLSWLYLGAQMILYSAEVNVVHKRRLWPRSLVTPPLNDKDKEALEALAKMEERQPDERITVSFEKEKRSAS